MNQNDTYISGETTIDFLQHEGTLCQVACLQHEIKFQRVYGRTMYRQDMQVRYIIKVVKHTETGWQDQQHQMVYGDEHEIQI